MPGLVAGVAHMPPDAELGLMDPGSVPVAIYGGEARCYPGKGSEVVMPIGRVRDSLDLQITRGEFYAWLMLHDTTKFLIEGVPLAMGGYAGARGTAFGSDGPRALTPAERAMVESGTAPEVGPPEFIDAMLQGSSGSAKGQ